MSINARLVRSWFPSWPIVKCIRTLNQSHQSNILFDPSDWLKTKPDVPASWAFTSDSCAALLTGELGANELVLLKSRGADNHMSRELWSQDGIVDQDFSKWSKSIERVQIVNLRSQLKTLENLERR